MAKPRISTPPSAKKKGKGLPPIEDTTNNLEQPTTDEKANLNLYVPAPLKREYKAFCAELNRTMADVFAEMFEKYKEDLRR